MLTIDTKMPVASQIASPSVADLLGLALW